MCAHSMHLKNALININIVIFFSYFQQLKHFSLPVIYCKLFKKNQFFLLLIYLQLFCSLNNINLKKHIENIYYY